jgi:hypothetical protein
VGPMLLRVLPAFCDAGDRRVGPGWTYAPDAQPPTSTRAIIVGTIGFMIGKCPLIGLGLRPNVGRTTRGSRQLRMLPEVSSRRLDPKEEP